MLRIVGCCIVCPGSQLSSVARSSYARAFGRNVRSLRILLDFSQEDLAYKARLHRTHISLIERGERSVRIETIERLAVALRVQPAELMPAVRLRRR